MTRRIGDNIILIEETPPSKCEMCGVIDELRPYGPNGEKVCFDCMMKDEPAAIKRFEALLKGEG